MNRAQKLLAAAETLGYVRGRLVGEHGAMYQDLRLQLAQQLTRVGEALVGLLAEEKDADQ